MGKWYGKAGFPTDRVDLGFELKRDDKGAITLALYGPIFNFYGLLVPGGLSRATDGTYVNTDWGFKFTLKNDELDGIAFGKTPFTLHRVDTLPSKFQCRPECRTGTEMAKQSWRLQFMGARRYTTVVAYVGTAGGEFHAINVKDGSFRWTYPRGPRRLWRSAGERGCGLFRLRQRLPLQGRPSDRQGNLALRSGRCTGCRVSRRTNSSEIAAPSTGISMHPNPCSRTAFLYVGSGDGGMNAIDPANGVRIWRLQAQGSIRAGAIIDGPRVIFGTMDNFAYALDRKSGSQIWRINTQGPIVAAPALIGNTLVLGVAAGLIMGLDSATGKILWHMQPWLSAIDSSAAADKGDAVLHRIVRYAPRFLYGMQRTAASSGARMCSARRGRHRR